MSNPDLEGEGAQLPMVIARNEETVREGFWPKLARVLAHIPFAEEAVAAYYCAIDSRTPLRARAILYAALAYFILPFDVIPDFIVGLGFTDDMAVLATAIGMIRSYMTEEHRAQAREAIARLKRGEPVSA
jgi:uncharacterized membrane protein YkvA (DUF1232 family)